MPIPFQETDLYAHPLSRTSSLMDTKDLQTLEGMGTTPLLWDPSQLQSGYRNRDTCLAVMCESATRNHAHRDARQAGSQAFLYH
jgi:hypothetical protein